MKIIQYSPTLTIIEQNACRRSISYYNDRYFLSMPPIIFFAHHTKSFRMKNVYGFFIVNKKLYQLPFYNINHDGWICLGRSKKIFKDVESLAYGFLESFWKSRFTMDIGSAPAIYKSKNKLLGFYNEWQAKTKKYKNWTPSRNSLISYNSSNKFNNIIKEICK